MTAESETHDLPREQKLALLKQLRKGLKLLHAQLLQAEAAPALQVCLRDPTALCLPLVYGRCY